MRTESWLGLMPLLFVLLIGGLIWAKARRSANNAAAGPVVAGGLPIPEYRGPLAFFRRHYNGDYSLARSYWVNTFFISLFAPLLGLFLLPWLNSNFPARYGSAGFLFITALGIVAYFWAVSGTWASATKHVQRGGTSVWATAAKVVIVLGVGNTIIDFVNLMPALQEHVRVATGTQLGAATKLEVRADGRSILLSGGINDGSAQQLDDALQLAPAVTTVVLSSNGGWIREGQMLADVIRKRGLNTYVDDDCASACTIAFLAGKDRAAAPSAKIGFHASRNVGSMQSNSSPEETAQVRAVYQDAGLPDDFVNNAINTPHGKMWYPSHEELLAAGVLTRKSTGGETAMLSTNVRSKAALVATFMETEAFAVLAERSPQDFDRVVEAAWVKMQSGATDAEVVTAARAQLGSVYPRFLPFASDETLVAFHRLMQDELEALREIDVNACVETAFPTGQPLNLAGLLPPELQARETVLMIKVLREADAARKLEPSKQETERVVRRAVAGMTQEQLVLFSDEKARNQSTPLLACDTAIAFFAGFNSLPVAERGHALRVLYSAN